MKNAKPLLTGLVLAGLVGTSAQAQPSPSPLPEPALITQCIQEGVQEPLIRGGYLTVTGKTTPAERRLLVVQIDDAAQKFIEWWISHHPECSRDSSILGCRVRVVAIKVCVTNMNLVNKYLFHGKKENLLAAQYKGQIYIRPEALRSGTDLYHEMAHYLIMGRGLSAEEDEAIAQAFEGSLDEVVSARVSR